MLYPNSPPLVLRYLRSETQHYCMLPLDLPVFGDFHRIHRILRIRVH